MTGYFTLTKLQIKLRLSALKPSNWRNARKEKTGKQLFTTLLIAFAIVVSLGAILFLEYKMFQGMEALGMSQMMLSIALLISMASCIFISFFYVISVLFFSRDSMFLAYLPTSSRTVFASKLSMILLGEGGISLLICMPICVLYGISINANLWFYVMAILISFAAPMLPIALVTIVANGLIRFSALWQHKDAWTMIGSVALLGVVMYFQLSMTSIMPEQNEVEFLTKMIMDRQGIMRDLFHAIPPVQWGTDALLGTNSLYNLLLFTAVSLGSVAIVVWLFGKGYNKLAVLQSENAQGKVSARKKSKFVWKQRSPMAALFQREWQEVLKTPAYTLNGLSGVIIMPIMIVAAYLGMKSQGLSIDISQISGEINQFMPSISSGLIILVIAALLSFAAGMNPIACTAISREGGKHYIARMIPVSPENQIRAKLLMGVSLSVGIALINGAMLIALLPSYTGIFLAAVVLAALFGFFATCWSLILDIQRPNLHWRTETEAIKQNFNVMIGVFGSMGLIVLLGFGAFALAKIGLGWTIICIIILALLIIACILSYMAVMHFAKTKYAMLEDET